MRRGATCSKGISNLVEKDGTKTPKSVLLVALFDSYMMTFVILMLTSG
jgi:hypothetical protein